MGEAKRRRQHEQMVAEGAPAPFFNIQTGQREIGRRMGRPMDLLREHKQALDAEDKGERASVSTPCNGCHACCYYKFVEVKREEVSAHDWEVLRPVQAEDGSYRLPKRDDESCAHLGPDGCTVYAHRPRSCRLYDCRLLALAGTGERFAGGAQKTPVWVPTIRDDADRAMVMALQATTQSYIAKHPNDFDPVSAMKYGLANFGPLLTKMRQMMAMARRLPAAEKRAFAEQAEKAIGLPAP